MREIREIGGYLELENFGGKEYYPGLCALNLGRTALLYLLRARGYKKIYLPYYLCDSVTEACREENCQIEFYRVDRQMRPLLEKKPEKDACVYLVNYYGQLTDDKILQYQSVYGRIIVDHVQAFFQKPLQGVDTIYSCRKFFGLPDGAYLSAEGLDGRELPLDRSASRMGHILGRYEDGGSCHYQTMLENAEMFHREPAKQMSTLTHNLLRGIDYQRVRQKRTENYEILREKLSEKNGMQFLPVRGALCYPFYTPKGCAIRKEMAQRRIYIPVYWGNVIREQEPGTAEYDFAANILALPCDQRYGREEMERIAEVLLELLEEKDENACVTIPPDEKRQTPHGGDV